MIGNKTPARKFSPFPAYADRAAWERIPKERKALYLDAAKGLKGHEWVSLPAIRYMDFYRDGNRLRYETPYFTRRSDLFSLAVAECLEGKGEYLEDIINGVWLICEESTWVVPAHNNHWRRGEGLRNELVNIEEPIYIDLFAAETASLLSWIYYLLGDEIARLSPLVKRRIELETERRILKPYLEDDTFDWMGLCHDNPVNNWNPWINSNILVCYLVFSGAFPGMTEPGVAKTIRSANRFLHFYAEDGGCDEGPGYFSVAGASLFDFVEELGHVADVADVYREPLIRNMASYIYKVYIGGDYFVNYADASPAPGMNVELLSRVGEKIADDNLVGFAAHLTAISAKDKDNHGALRSTLFRKLSNLFDRERAGSFTAPLSSYFGGIEVVAARERAGGLGGLFFSAKGGCNAESHNHNDVGSFLLYRDGTPVVVDAGVEQYTKFTFNEKRYTLWTMQSCYHNTPTVNGADQLPGREYRAEQAAYSVGGGTTSFSLDLAKAYPESAGIDSYRRSFSFSGAEGLTVTDAYSIKDAKAPLVLNFLLGDKPELSAGKAILSGRVLLAFDGGELAASVDEIPLTDAKIHGDWSRDFLYRLRLTAKAAKNSGSLTLHFTKTEE